MTPGAAKRLQGWLSWQRRSGNNRVRHVSPLTLRILAVNIMALAILVGSLLYLGRYQDRIIANELDSLLLQSRIIASAVAEGAIVIDDNDHSILSPLLARLMVRRLAETAETRTRLFDSDDTLLADSRTLLNKTNKIQIETLSPGDIQSSWQSFLGPRFLARVFDLIDLIHERREYPLLVEQDVQRGSQYEAVTGAATGDMKTQVWRNPDGRLTLAAAVPVQHYKHVLGVVMMSRSDNNIDRAITTVRFDILKIFGITLLITVLLSLYLARAIARPIHLLALAAEGLRHGQTQIVGLVGTASLLRPDAIPDLTGRHDEIGDLSGALRDLTKGLAERIGSIENFAADVAHEIKNPLTSLRSAVETLEKVKTDPASCATLMAIIRDDIDRLDRLITDISSASRLDAELIRAKGERVDVGAMLASLADYYRTSAGSQNGLVVQPVDGSLIVTAVKARLVEVLQNLIDNALSFSPPDRAVTVLTGREGRFIRITVSDCGPGIPDNKLEAIFDRFYTERPKAEKFGTHSGLGLSIARQIVDAHRGKIWAENIKDAAGANLGARFVVLLPDAAN